MYMCPSCQVVRCADCVDRDCKRRPRTTGTPHDEACSDDRCSSMSFDVADDLDDASSVNENSFGIGDDVHILGSSDWELVGKFGRVVSLVDSAGMQKVKLRDSDMIVLVKPSHMTIVSPIDDY